MPTEKEIEEWLKENKRNLRPLPDSHWSYQKSRQAHLDAMRRGWKALARRQQVQMNLLSYEIELLRSLLPKQI